MNLSSGPWKAVPRRRGTTWAAAGIALALIVDMSAHAADTIPSFGLLDALNSNADSDLSEDFNVRFATDAAGHWVAVWQVDGALGDDFDVLFSRSTDDGVTWSAPAPIDAAAAFDLGDDTSPAVSSGGAGVWLAIWSSTEAAGGLGTDADILVARSTNDGLSWSAATAIDAAASSDTLLDERPEVASDGAGTWVALWETEDATAALHTDTDVRFARSTDGGLTWSPPAFLTPDAATDERADRVPRIAHDGSATWLAVWQVDDTSGAASTDNDVAAARSIDGGASWSAPILLNPNDEGGARDDFDPHLASDGAGNWMVVWDSTDALDAIEEDYDILAAHSSDGGLSWTPPFLVNLDGVNDTAADLDPQVVSDGAGGWIVTWQSSEARVTGVENGFHVRMARTRDAGVTWTPPEWLTPRHGNGATGDFDPQIRSAASGTLAVASYHFGGLGSDTDILVAQGSEPFGPSAPLHNAAASDGVYDSRAVLVAAGPGVWVALWSADGPAPPGGTGQDIVGVRSQDGGLTWSDPVAVAVGATAVAEDTAPEVASDTAGTLVSVWESTAGILGTDADVLFARSADGGASWSAPAPLAADAAADARQDTAPAVATDAAGNFVALWQADDPAGPLGADTDILVARSADAGVSWTVPSALDAAAGSDTANDQLPRITHAGTTWLAVWQADDPLGLPGDFDVRVARSTDAGVSWSVPALLDTAAQGTVASGGEPHIASGGAGVWLASWHAIDPAGPLGGDTDVLLSRSIDDGLTWSAPTPLEADAGSDSHADEAADLVSDGIGNWFAVWQSNATDGTTGPDFDVWVVRSGDDGVSWSAPVPLNSHARHDSGVDWEPRVASDRAGHWLASWRSTDAMGAIGLDVDVLFARGRGPDSDDDGLHDAAELGSLGTDPALADSDGDGLTDGEEVLIHGSDPGVTDSDGDMLSDFDELWLYGADPLSTDGDADGLGDYDEVFTYGTNPLAESTDSDSLSDYDEIFVYGTNPLTRDTDNDDFDDDDELAAGTDPNDPLSFPAPGVPSLGALGALLLSAGLLLAGRRRIARVGPGVALALAAALLL